MPLLSNIEFVNLKDPKGYQLVRLEASGSSAAGGESPAGDYVVGKGLPEEEREFILPLNQRPDLYLVFARYVTDPESLLNFVHEHGQLMATTAVQYRGDLVNHVLMEASVMRKLHTAMMEDRAPDWDYLGDPKARPSKGEHVGYADIAPPSDLSAAIVWDAVKQRLFWKFRPRTLLDGLWLQCGQAISRGAEIRDCAQCGVWFEAGRGSGRRAGAKFCSEEHKIAFHSHKRSKEK
jgi:hypothetical protein